MDFKGFQQIWSDFLAFLDRAFQWLKYLFATEDEAGDSTTAEWPPKDYPDFNA